MAPDTVSNSPAIQSKRQFWLGLLCSVFGFLLLVSAGWWLESKYDFVHTAEIEFTAYSPKGPSGGSIIPASCEAAYEHNAGECVLAPMGYHDRLDCDYIQGWSCDPNNPGARPVVHIYRYDPWVDGPDPNVPGAQKYVGQAVSNEFRPDLPLHPAVCGGFPDGQYQYTFPVPGYAEDGRTVSYYVYSLDDGSFGFAGNPLLTNSPRAVTCALPTPTITGWSCVLGPAGERQLRINWNRAPGYSSVYLRTEQNENTAAYVPYAPGTSENYVGDSITFNITPGAEYDFWMHTRKANGGYSAAVRLDNMVCNNPPPPANPASQCTYDDATDTFTARISWNNPPGFNTYYTRVSTAGYGNPDVASRLVWNDNFQGTTFTFPANRNLGSQTPRYYWWVHTKDTSNAWWSTDVNQSTITPGINYLVCPLPAPRAVTNKSATCTATPWNPSNTARFTMTARFAQWFDVEYRLRSGGTTNSLNNVSSGHTVNAVSWGEYEYRVRGENQDGGNPVQSGPWSSWENFECLPPNPVISIDATPRLVTKDSPARLTWRIQANYDLNCTLSGGGMTPEVIQHRYNPAAPGTLTTERTASSPFVTSPIQNTTDFIISCDPLIASLPNLAETEATVRVEVVPSLEER